MLKRPVASALIAVALHDLVGPGQQWWTLTVRYRPAGVSANCSTPFRIPTRISPSTLDATRELHDHLATVAAELGLAITDARVGRPARLVVQ